MLLDVAGDPVKQPVALDVITTVTTCPLVNDVVVKVALFVPVFVPFTRHWYEGTVPPFVGVAVNVTLSPAQIVLSASLDSILTLAGKLGFTVVVMLLDVAGEPVVQGELEVTTTVTT
jgi:hypothetical protein